MSFTVDQTSQSFRQEHGKQSKRPYISVFRAESGRYVTSVAISDWIRKNVPAEFHLSLLISMEFCPRASFPQDLSWLK